MESEPKKCAVCGDQIHPLANLRKRCKKLRDRGNPRNKPNKKARTEALKRAWDGKAFRCYYSKIRLEEVDKHNPRYLTYDHRIPKNEDDIVVAAACINDRKTDLDEGEFKAIVLALASAFQGNHFDESVLNFKHWKR